MISVQLKQLRVCGFPSLLKSSLFLEERSCISYLSFPTHSPHCSLTDQPAVAVEIQDGWTDKRARVALWGRHILVASLILTRRPPSYGIPSVAHPLQHHGWKQCEVPL